MRNYKPSLQSINCAGAITHVPFNAIIKMLTEPVRSGTAADAMQYNGAVYQVPTGKTFRLLGFIVWTQNATTITIITISEGDTEDAETTLKHTFQVNTAVVRNLWEYYLDVSFASGKFITINVDTTIVDFVAMVGYEF